MLRMIDEQGKPTESCFFLFCADDPPSCHPLVRRGLRTEKLPSALVFAKSLFLSSGEASVLALLVRVNARLSCAARYEGLKAGRVHQPLLSELSNAFDVN